ncbi:hypothetical protein C0389_02205 [bacterium]|nr:hypothetical protein [bacterium]
MIEIKITIDSALSLLLERMNLELKLRQRDKIIPIGLRLEDLSYNQLFLIVEASIFDTIFLLPIDLVSQETNLINIITGTVRALSRVLNRDEFKLFTNKQASNLIQPIISYFQSQLKWKHFPNN